MLKLEDCIILNGTFRLRAHLSVPARSRVAVIGPSGAGKSTLIEAIAGFLAVETGQITWNGSDITRMPPGARPLAMLFQDDNLFPHLSVAQNVGLGIHPNLRLSASERSSIEKAIERVGLGSRKPSELSGGQRSRAALARVLVQRRDLLLLDEPFAALGPALRAEMLDLVADLCDETGATLLMISHAPEDARRIAGQAILVAEGQAREPQDTTALLDNPPKVLREYLG